LTHPTIADILASLVANHKQPRTLLEAVKHFSDKDTALQFIAALKWPDGVECPSCGSKKVGFLSTRRLWKCRDCAKQFSAKVGTIFEDSPIGLEKWIPAMWTIVNCNIGISSYELARALGVTQKTAWFMLKRIRAAMQSNTFRKFGDHIEVDETFIAGKARSRHKGKLNHVLRNPTGRSPCRDCLNSTAKRDTPTCEPSSSPTRSDLALDESSILTPSSQ
jgi:transposase-like protein